MDDLIKRVLFADDDDDYRLTLAEYFGDKTSLIWEMAENGVVALDKALAQYFNLIVLDINMPFMKGNETVKIIKEQLPKVKVLAFTGKCDDESVRELLTDGFDDVIKKPISLQVFEQTLMKHLYAEKSVVADRPTPKTKAPAATRTLEVEAVKKPSLSSQDTPSPPKAASAQGAPAADPAALKNLIRTLKMEKAGLEQEIAALKLEIQRLKQARKEVGRAGAADIPESEIATGDVETFEIE